jgi:competence protein ComEC
LRARGEHELHLLMLSHRDADHVGGAAALLAALPVRALSSSLESGHALLAQAAERGVPHTPCQAGQHWQWDGVQFDVLHPQPAELALAESRSVKPNALSCVLRVRAAAPAGAELRSALLTGDIEAAQEAALVAAHAGSTALRSQLLLVPHHGSRSSSTAAFLDAVQPRLAVVQAAYRSRFGHPAPDVVARYEARGIAVMRSDRCGALSWSLPGEGTALQCQRETQRRYWHHPDGYPVPTGLLP